MDDVCLKALYSREKSSKTVEEINSCFFIPRRVGKKPKNEYSEFLVFYRSQIILHVEAQTPGGIIFVYFVVIFLEYWSPFCSKYLA
jgi:hypothetical protein